MKSDTAKSIHKMLDTLHDDDMASISKRLTAKNLTDLDNAIRLSTVDTSARVFDFEIGDTFVNKEGIYGIVSFIHVNKDTTFYHGRYYFGMHPKLNKQITRHTGGLTSNEITHVTQGDFNEYTGMVYNSNPASSPAESPMETPKLIDVNVDSICPGGAGIQ